jgi:hypothetical protein
MKDREAGNCCRGDAERTGSLGNRPIAPEPLPASLSYSHTYTYINTTLDIWTLRSPTNVPCVPSRYFRDKILFNPVLSFIGWVHMIESSKSSKSLLFLFKFIVEVLFDKKRLYI